MKRALTDPRLFSGIGNAYSDEILHRARLSPAKLTQRLSDGGDRAPVRGRAGRPRRVDRAALGTRPRRAFPEKVTAFREGMAVHGRYGKPCPVCGTPVQRIVYAENESNYCATCQTGGKLLADRALSQLLRGDWPKTLEELEERKKAAGPSESALTADEAPRGLRWLSWSRWRSGSLGRRQTPSPDAAARDSQGRLRWSLAAGYGFTVKLSRGRAEEQLLLVTPAVAYAFSRPFELFVEGHLSGFFTPDGYMLGIVPIGARYSFSAGATQPYLALGAGFGWTTWRSSTSSTAASTTSCRPASERPMRRKRLVARGANQSPLERGHGPAEPRLERHRLSGGLAVSVGMLS